MSEFISTIVRQVETCLVERESDILEAWHENIEEANENEKKFPPLKLSIASSVDLEANAIETSVSFTVKYTATVKDALPDPDQGLLPFASGLKPGESVEITGGDVGVKIEHGGKVTPIGKQNQIGRAHV